MSTIVVMSGSLRGASVNTAALLTVRRLLVRRGEEVRAPMPNLRALPYYDQDLDVGPGPDPVARLRLLVGNADALVISTPSYNGGAPGVLKNALDWLSRPWGASALTGLPVALMSASPGPRGALDAQPGLVRNIERSGGVLIPHPALALGNAEELPSGGDGFTDPSAVGLLDDFTEAVWAARRGVPQAVSQAGAAPV